MTSQPTTDRAPATTVPPAGERPGFWARLGRDAADLRTWLGATWAGWGHRRAGTKAGANLDEALRALGTAAVDEPACEALQAHAGARAAGDALEAARASEQTATAALAEAKRALEGADAAAATRKAELAAELGRAERAHQGVEQEARTALTEVEALEAEGQDAGAQRQRLASLGTRLEEGQASVATARAALRADVEARAAARKPLVAQRDEAQRAVRAARDACGHAEQQQAQAHRALGRDVATTDLSAPALTQPLTRVRAAEGASQARAADAATAAATARAAAAGAKRFTWKAALALAAVIVVAVLWAGLGGEPTDAEPPARSSEGAAIPDRAPPPPKPTPTKPTPPKGTPPAAPAEPTPPPAGPAVTPEPAPEPADEPPPEPATLLSKSVVEAVLALPSVAERRAGEVVLQRPVGAPQAEAITPVAGGGWRLRVRAEVERRVDAAGEPQRFGVIIQVLVDAQRVPLQVRVLGEVDPEFEALFDD